MKAIIVLVLAALGLLATALPSGAAPSHAIAMHGAPLHPPGFTHFPYANPDAPKGGQAIFAVQGSFDSLNPLIVMGVSPSGIREYVYESLMARSFDEPFSLYGLLADSIDVPPDRSSVTFTIRPEARFSDGKPLTVDDVIFSFELLRDHGRPNHRSYYKKIRTVEKTGERGVRFVFEAGDREMPLIIGLMPVLPRHRIDPARFDRTTLTPPVGSGPYVVARIEPGKSITYTRNPNWWGADLAVNRGLYNFDEIRYEYYRDTVTMFEAFKKGLYHLRAEDDPTRWAEGYDIPAVADGRIVKASFPIGTPAGMTGLVFNTRRPVFQDRRVRLALIQLLDFGWINKTLFHGLYSRTQSYFARSELSSAGRPADARERVLLEPFPDAVTPEIMAGGTLLPAGDGSGRDRDGRRRALGLLEEAGYGVVDGRLVEKKTGTPFTFEMLAATRSQERLFLTYARALKQIGIEARIRQVDSAQYQRRKQTFDFDMIQNVWPASLSPGNEQGFRWSSLAADAEGSFNYAGVKSPAVDAMIGALLAAETREDFVSAVRVLDRALLSGAYVVPLFFLPQQWVAYWSSLHPSTATPLYGFQLDTWWLDRKPSAAAARP